MAVSIGSVAARLSSPSVRSASLPRFVTGPTVTTKSWTEWATSNPSQTLDGFLDDRLRHNLDKAGHGTLQDMHARPQLVIFGEQHHQPKVLAAQLKLIHKLVSEPFNFKVTVIMEHFNLQQQTLLDDFAKTGDAETLRDEYAKSSEGFRLNNSGYLPLLNLIRELDNVKSAVKAGFPPREWARTIMRQGKEVLQQDKSVVPGLNSFGRWEDIDVSPEHAAYITSSISGEKPELPDEVSQGGLKAAQAFKDAIMAWRIDEELERMRTSKASQGSPSEEILVAICGSGHCEYGFGITERIRSCKREDMLLLVCKPDDGMYWTDSRQGKNKMPGERAIADGIIIYEAVDV